MDEKKLIKDVYEETVKTFVLALQLGADMELLIQLLHIRSMIAASGFITCGDVGEICAKHRYEEPAKSAK
jgi:hypothetical protein